MKITFLTTHLNVFGSVRELVENANELINLGHEVTIYNKMNSKCDWLPCQAEIKQVDTNRNIKIDTDVLILMDSPFPDLFHIFETTNAKFKTMIMMGFDPENFELNKENILKENIGREGTQTQRNLVHIIKNYTMCADGWWQIDHFESLGLPRGHSIGGVNLRQFYNKELHRTIDLGYSGDPRPRKGTGIVKQAIESLTYSNGCYYKRGDQKFLVDFLNGCTLFIDNHLRAGWCNPVLEAMACGCVPICNDIGASKDFAIDGETAIVLTDNSVNSFVKAIDRLMNDRDEIKHLQRNGLFKAAEYDYKVTVPKFAEFLENQI